MSEPRTVDATSTPEDLEELELLEEGLEELDVLEEEPTEPSRPAARSSAPGARTSAPPPVPPEARRSSLPPAPSLRPPGAPGTMPPPRSGMFLIGTGEPKPQEPTTGVHSELRARALEIERLRLKLRMRDDRIRELERALSALAPRERELTESLVAERARVAQLEQALSERDSQQDAEHAIERLRLSREEGTAASADDGAGLAPRDAASQDAAALAAIEDRVHTLERALAEERARSESHALAFEHTLAEERTRREAREHELERAVASERLHAQQLAAELEALRIQSAGGDDLKRISGIGPAFERALIRLGVTSYEDVAAWSAEDVLRMAAALNISPRRIERDGWVQRAALLAAARPNP